MDAACLLLAAGAVLAGCVSSEESGSASGRAHSPQAVRRQIATTRSTVRQAPASDSVLVRRDTIALRSAPKFSTRKDTVLAAFVRKQKPAPRVNAPIERPANPKYTIQLGAFARADNALRAQKRARTQFPDLPIFNTFIPGVKIYRVSVGRFNDRRAAQRFRLALLASHSEEYAQCWINYIAP